MAMCGLDVESTLKSSGTELSCKTFVLAVYSNDMRRPVRLRSYISRYEEVATRNCRVYQAALATTAVPGGHFLPVGIGASTVPLLGAFLGFPNPTKEAFDESLRIWNLSSIASVVSIGVGILPPVKLVPDGESILQRLLLPDNLIRCLASIASDSERCHREFESEARHLGLKYFRFNVGERLGQVRSEESSKFNVVVSETDHYLQLRETTQMLSYCALHLLEG